MLPSFSFGAEGVEYGRSSAYYATTAGSAVFPNDVDVKGNLSVQGFTSLDDTQVSGTLTVAQPLTGGTRTAYFTNGASPPAEKSVAIFNDQALGTLIVMRNTGNEGNVAFDGGVTGGQFVLTRPLVLPSGGGSSGSLTVGGNATVNAGVLAAGGYYGANSTAPASAPVGLVGGSVVTPVSLPAGLVSSGAVTAPEFSGPESLTPNYRYIQVGLGLAGDGGIPTPPDGTQGANNYWTQTYTGTALQTFINNVGTSVQTIFIVVLPNDFFTAGLVSGPVVINPKYVGKTLYRLWIAINNTSSVDVQFRVGSVTGTQVALQVFSGAASPGFQATAIVGVPSATSGATAPLYYGICAYNLATLGEVPGNAAP